MRVTFYFKFMLAASLLLTGCSVFSPVTSVNNTTYVISSIPKVPVHRRHSGIIFVGQPATLPIYNTTDMAYSNYLYQVGYFVKSSWAATPAQMLQPLMVQTLQNTKHYTSVTSALGVGQYDYLLNTQLTEFLQDFTGGQNIFRLRARLQLVNSATNVIVASKEIVINVPAPQNSAYGGVIAANRAVNEFLASMARFCNLHS